MCLSTVHFPPSDRRHTKNEKAAHSKSHLTLLLQLTRQTMYVQRNTEARWRNRCCIGKAISIAYSECVFVALFIQHAMRMRPVILSSVECPALLYLSTLSHKRHDFRGGDVTEHKNVGFDFV